MGSVVYTIGYSGRTIAEFLDLLREHAITAVADVRSQPHSKFNADFSQDSLRLALGDGGFTYVFLGAELGARSSDEDCYIEGKVQYDKLATTAAFRAGLNRVEKGRGGHTIALLCAESDPLICHRCILVSRRLVGRGIPVRHILEDGRSEEHEATIRRLILALRIPELYPSWSEDEIRDLAYRIRGDEIAFQKSTADLQYPLWGEESAR